jgi:hypothetical protein
MKIDNKAERLLKAPDVQAGRDTDTSNMQAVSNHRSTKK